MPAQRITYLTSKPFTLSQLMAKTPRNIQYNADDTRIKQARKIIDKDTNQPAVVAVVYSTHDADGNPTRNPIMHKCYILSLDANRKPINQCHVHLSCDCFTGDTRVLTPSGWKTIYELAEPLELGKFETDYIVNGKVVKGSAPFYKGKSKVWEIALDTGLKIKATKNQKFLVTRKDGIRKWRTVKNLSVGDWLVPNSTENIPEVDVTSKVYQDAHLIGVIMGDGTVFSSGSPDLQLYGDKQTEIWSLIQKHPAVKGKKVVQRDGIRVEFNHTGMELFSKFKYENKKNVLLSSPESIFGFLSGLTNADGNCGRNGIVIDGDLSYLKILLDELLALGLVGPKLSLSDTNRKGTLTNYGERTKDMYTLVIPVPTIRLIKKNLLLTEKHQKNLEKQEKKRPQNRVPKTKITGITCVGKKHVYDITVPEGTRFVAEGVIVHNCAYFMYTLEYALNKRGNADIIFSNGKPAVVRNPSNKGFLCKHLYHLAESLVSRGM